MRAGVRDVSDKYSIIQGDACERLLGNTQMRGQLDGRVDRVSSGGFYCIRASTVWGEKTFTVGYAESFRVTSWLATTLH